MIQISDYLQEETISSSYLYRGRIVNIRQDRVKISGGQTAFREIVEHPGAVAVVAMTEKKEVVLVRQHRQPAGEVLLEIPAGKLEPGETPVECARREMIEETGYDAETYNELTCFFPSPGFCDEKIYLFFAGQLKRAERETTDFEERLSTVYLSLEKALEMINSGDIKDGKTILALQMIKLQQV